MLPNAPSPAPIFAVRSPQSRPLPLDAGFDARSGTRGREAIDAMLGRVVPAVRGTGGGWVAALGHCVLRGTRLGDVAYSVSRLTAR